MNAHPTVADIRRYLRASGWQQAPATWRDATVWSSPEGYEVLVPPRDDLHDISPRIQDILNVLTRTEQRPPNEIADDIRAPVSDVQYFRTHPADDLPPGSTSLHDGLRALQGIRNALAAATRTVVEGPKPRYGGDTPPQVGALLNRAQLEQTRPGSYIFVVRMPLAAELSRPVSTQLHASMRALNDAAGQATPDDLSSFDNAVTAGVSANLCRALAGLAGDHGRQPFEVSFRWARDGEPAEVSTIEFAPGLGRTANSAARHLEQVAVSGPATATGYVEGLHDRPGENDRWRIEVRGELTTETGSTGRSVWVRLGSQSLYEQAIAAHRSRQPVRAQGELSTLGARIELIVGADGFGLLG